MRRWCVGMSSPASVQVNVGHVLTPYLLVCWTCVVGRTVSCISSRLTGQKQMRNAIEADDVMVSCCTLTVRRHEPMTSLDAMLVHGVLIRCDRCSCYECHVSVTLTHWPSADHLLTTRSLVATRHLLDQLLSDTCKTSHQKSCINYACIWYVFYARPVMPIFIWHLK